MSKGTYGISLRGSIDLPSHNNPNNPHSRHRGKCIILPSRAIDKLHGPFTNHRRIFIFVFIEKRRNRRELARQVIWVRTLGNQLPRLLERVRPRLRHRVNAVSIVGCHHSPVVFGVVVLQLVLLSHRGIVVRFNTAGEGEIAKVVREVTLRAGAEINECVFGFEDCAVEPF